MEGSTVETLSDRRRSFARRYSQALLRHPWWAIAGSLLLCVLLGSGARNLTFKGDYRVFFSSDNPHLKAFEALQDVYSKRDNVLFALQPRDGQVFSPDCLAAVQALTEEAWRLPFVTRVDSITNFQYSWARGDELIVEDLIADLKSLSPAELEQRRRIARAEPLLVGRLLSPDTSVTAVNATVLFDDESQEDQAQMVAAARALAESLRARFPDLEIYLSGTVLHNNAFTEAATTDAGTLIPGMYLAILLLLGYFFRSVTATLSTLLVIALSSAAAMGTGGWLGISVTPPSVLAPTLIMTLAVADAVHLLLPFLQKLHRGVEKRQALVDSLAINFQPVFLTSLTTCIGFLAMNVSDVPPLNDLGNITAVGVMVAFLLTVVLLPALLAVLPLKARPSRGSASGKWMDPLASALIRHPARFLLGMVAAAGLLAILIPRNELDDRFVEYFDERITFRTDTDFITENLTGLYQIEFSLETGEEGGIADPRYLNRVEAFTEWWRAQPEVLHVASITDLMKRLNQNLHGDDPAYHRLPEERTLAAQYLLLFEMSLPLGLDLNDQIDIDKTATRFTASVANISSRELRQLAERAEIWLRENAPTTMHAQGVSPAIMFAHISDRSIAGMLLGGALSFLLITVCLIFALRSLRFGLLSLIPNVLPATMAFGAWGLLNGQVGFGLSIVLAMTLGIVVDDTVHFVSKYLHARRELDLEPEEALRYVFTTVGKALWVTSLALTGGFAILATSTFAQNSDMSLLTAITILFALACDFLLLPPLLLYLDRPAGRTILKGHDLEADELSRRNL